MNPIEIRVKDSAGGEKCSKLAQMADIPATVLLELMEHYGKGREKYPGDAAGPNYSKGYAWSLSYNAAMRHLLQFWAGEDLDAETGSKHVIAAAWHCLCLALFMDRRRNKDDRWEKAPDSVADYTSGTAQARLEQLRKELDAHMPKPKSLGGFEPLTAAAEECRTNPEEL